MRTKAIANAIEKDLLADRPQSQHQSQLCFACGRSYCHGDSRFCSPRCRNAFDAGAPPHGESEPRRSTYTWLNGRPMQARGDGFAIECKSVPSGVGVDTPLWWSSGSGGVPKADQWIRDKYGLHHRTVQAVLAGVIGGSTSTASTHRLQQRPDLTNLVFDSSSLRDPLAFSRFASPALRRPHAWGSQSCGPTSRKIESDLLQTDVGRRRRDLLLIRGTCRL
jgi:hypothetical protein